LNFLKEESVVGLDRVKAGPCNENADADDAENLVTPE
jgi:hypothetical protein